MKIKGGEQGARIAGIRPEMAIALIAVNEVFKEASVECVITSFCEGKHSVSSRHYSGLAFDIRLNDIPSAKHILLKDAVKAALGDDFDVIVENSGTTLVHLHVEFDPKRAIGAI